MCVLQDFEALTPNLLARTIETVEGGGLVVLLLKTMTSLKQLYTMAMVCPFVRYLRCTHLTSFRRTYMLATEHQLMIQLSLDSTNASSFPWVHARPV